MPKVPDQGKGKAMLSKAKLSGPRLQAVLYADVHGYTRLVEQDETRTVACLARAVAVIRDLVPEYGGAVANTAGDGLVAIFGHADQALHFALDMQQNMPGIEGGTLGTGPIRFRIGISVGETFFGAEGVYGHSVNLAARVQAFASPGGICVTDEVCRLVSPKTELRLRSLGIKRLKNISTPVEIYTVECPSQTPQAAIARRRDLADSDDLHDASIAVLPLDNLSQDPEVVYLCQGLTADLITTLGRFRDLAVIARHSSSRVAAESLRLRDVGEKLGVRYLLTGSFRRSGDRIRIAVELIEAASESLVWSDRYDGHLGDIFDFQDEVAATTAARVAAQIDSTERRRLARQPHPAFYAYGLVLRGQEMEFCFRPEVNQQARMLFAQACELEPDYGRSYAALSRTFNIEWRYNWTTDHQGALKQALNLAQRAVICDPTDARGFGEMGLAHLYLRQHDDALAAYEHAIQLNPNDADLLAFTGDCLAYLRQGDRAVELIERAIRLNPLHPDSYLWFMGDAYFHQGAYGRVIETLNRMQDRSEGHRLLAASHALLGQMDEARHHADEVLRVHPNFTIEHWRTVPPLKHVEDMDVFADGLRMAGLH